MTNATGLDISGWEASVWIPHAMYENGGLPAGLSHDEIERIERAAEDLPPAQDGVEKTIADILEGAVLIGNPLGASESPGEGWARLRWQHLLQRLNADPPAAAGFLDGRCFGYESWPANIQPPAEGSLDREQLTTLLGHLAASSRDGKQTRTYASYGAIAVGEFDEDVLFVGALEGVLALYDDPTLSGSPSNFWPEDRSWFVYTDWDLWATKVSGSHDLIQHLLADLDLETLNA